MEQHPRNIPELKGRQIVLEPKLGMKIHVFRTFCCELANKLAVNTDDDKANVIAQAREDIQAFASGPVSTADLALQFCSSVVVDFIAQDWRLKLGSTGIVLQAPETNGATPLEIKQRIRTGHLFARDAQLREGAVTAFIKGMEQRRLAPSGWVSIFSLMRDGRDLAEQLRAAQRENDETKRSEMLACAVSPYIQVVEPEVVCSLTGFKLTDIWRYFRHTWVSTYKSLPGRSMTLLVRDASAPNHPVIGIAALGSSMAQQTLRDKWIGWDSETFLKMLHQNKSAKWCRWVHQSVERLLDGIYWKDLAANGIIRQRDLQDPTDEVIEQLTKAAVRAAKAHQINADAINHKRNGNGAADGGIDWEKQALTPLFRAKRARMLALVLGIRRNLRIAGLTDESEAALARTLATAEGRHAIQRLVRLVKAEHVGVDMMDIIICGAVAPYNTLLGGKLVCMMLMSPEVVSLYRKRYGRQRSIIASSMKGAAVVREPNLVLLATTSLYGVGSSQYNRIRVPVSEIGYKGNTTVTYFNLGMSKGYGSYHFSTASIDYLETLLPRGGEGRKVNSIFGEGVNPLMRKLRDGLCYVGLPADELLLHGNPRIVYSVPLAQNFRQVLMGLTTRPVYYFPLIKPGSSTKLLGAFWRKRWLAGRITRPGILEAVATHTLSYPVTHGARVRLPEERPVSVFV